MKLSEIELAKLPLGCHRLPHRSFFFHGKQFPVCARCTGVLVGYFAFPVFLFGFWPAYFVAGVLLNVPAAIDGSTQLIGWRQSTNLLRISTGLMSGVGQAMVASAVGQWLGLLLRNFLG